MPFVRNTWYVAAWSHEVTRDPVARVVCEQPIALYRTQDGTAVGLADRCAHRGYPLSAGRVIEDSIECGYHGFAFGCDGICTRVPAQSTIPARAKVRTYPLHEKDGWIWVWPGDPELADVAPTATLDDPCLRRQVALWAIAGLEADHAAALSVKLGKLFERLPDTHWMNDPAWATVTHSYRFECRADLVHDNLLDLTHESFLHRTTVGDDYIYEHGITVEVDGTTVTVDRLMPGVEAPPLYAATMGVDGLYDRFHATEFSVPNHHTLHSGITGRGRPREEGYLIKVLNGITPIDEHSCWYYYAFCRNFGIENTAATEDLRLGLATVLDEDAEALRLQELALQARPVSEHDVLIAQDAGVAKARRVMTQLLAAEAATAGDPSSRRAPTAPAAPTVAVG